MINTLEDLVMKQECFAKNTKKIPHSTAAKAGYGEVKHKSATAPANRREYFKPIQKVR